jgi:hypothetical protein
LIAFGFSMVPGWGEPAEAPPARIPRFPYTATGDDHMKEALRLHLATRPPWPIFARTAAAQQQPVVFEIRTDRTERTSSFGGAPRGYAQAVLKVRLDNLPPFEISDFAETPIAVYVRGNENPHEIGFRQAETDALNNLLPYVCARLVRLSGDAGQIQAMQQMAERRWPEEIALQVLRGLGPAASSSSDRLAALLESHVKDDEAPDNVLTVLLAVDERRGSEALGSLADKLGGRGVPIVLQHLEFERTANEVRTLSTFPPFALPGHGALTPADAETVLQWVRRSPAVATVCARVLLGFGNDPRAATLLQALPELAPEQADAIRELMDDDKRNREDQARYEKQERERAEAEKLNERLAEEERAKEKAGEK